MNTGLHTHSAFDRDLERLQALLIRLGGLVEVAIQSSAKSLDRRDEVLATRVRQGDRAIDALDEQINQDAAHVIALRQPVAVDLRIVLTVMRISNNLERIGDYAKNMGKRTTALVDLPPIMDTTASLRRMSRDVELMLKDALDAFIQRDAELARDVIQRDQEVDQLYNALFRQLLTFMMEEPRNITACMHLHFIAKNVERMGDHVTNIAEQVVYLVTGALPEDGRPKADRTSFETGDDEAK